MGVIRGIITRIEEARSLLILAYIGHGVIDPVTEMLKLQSGRSTIQWKPFQESFMEPTDLLPGSIDRLAIFDCCYAGGAIRSTSETTSKVITACGKNEIARVHHVDSVSFTQRLCCAIT